MAAKGTKKKYSKAYQKRLDEELHKLLFTPDRRLKMPVIEECILIYKAVSLSDPMRVAYLLDRSPTWVKLRFEIGAYYSTLSFNQLTFLAGFTV